MHTELVSSLCITDLRSAKMLTYIAGDGVHAVRSFAAGKVIMPFRTSSYLLDGDTGVGNVLAEVAARDSWPLLGGSSGILHARNDMAAKIQTTQIPSRANVELKTELVPMPHGLSASQLRIYYVVASRDIVAGEELVLLHTYALLPP